MHIPGSILLFASLVVPATGRTTVPLPWSCATIKYYASGLTPTQLDRLSRMYRLTREQHAEALRCLKKADA